MDMKHTNDSHRDSDSRPSPEEMGFHMTDLVDTLAAILRGATVVGVFVLLVVGIYLAIDVFHAVGKLILDPAEAESAVAAIGELIDGENLVIAWDEENPTPLGNLIAFILLLVCYLIWLYVPATIISVSGRVLLSSVRQRPPPLMKHGRG
jgi:hypothetical protein